MHVRIIIVELYSEVYDRTAVMIVRCNVLEID